MTLTKCKGNVSAVAGNASDPEIKRQSCGNLKIFQQINPL
jgi:hypothetical protein